MKEPIVNQSWIACDLDGTLAKYEGWKGIHHIGPVLEPMKQRILTWLDNGQNVKIFTARACVPGAIPFIERWLKDNGLEGLEVTNVKDFDIIQLWDDLAIQVEFNTGNPVIS